MRAIAELILSMTQLIPFAIVVLIPSHAVVIADPSPAVNPPHTFESASDPSRKNSPIAVKAPDMRFDIPSNAIFVASDIAVHRAENQSRRTAANCENTAFTISIAPEKMSLIASHAVDVVSLIVSHAPLQSHVNTWKKSVTTPHIREKARSKIPLMTSNAPPTTWTIFAKVVEKNCPILSRNAVTIGCISHHIVMSGPFMSSTYAMIFPNVSSNHFHI